MTNVSAAFPPVPALSSDNPGELIPATPGALPGALPGRGGGRSYAQEARGTLSAAQAAAQGLMPTGLLNGLPFDGNQPSEEVRKAARGTVPMSQAIAQGLTPAQLFGGLPFAERPPLEGPAPPPRVDSQPAFDLSAQRLEGAAEATVPPRLEGVVPFDVPQPPLVSGAIPAPARLDTPEARARDSQPVFETSRILPRSEEAVGFVAAPPPAFSQGALPVTDASDHLSDRRSEPNVLPSGEAASPWMTASQRPLEPIYQPPLAPVPAPVTPPLPAKKGRGGLGVAIALAVAIVVLGLGVLVFVLRGEILGVESRPQKPVLPKMDPAAETTQPTEPSVPESKPSATASVRAPLVVPPTPAFPPQGSTGKAASPSSSPSPTTPTPKATGEKFDPLGI